MPGFRDKEPCGAEEVSLEEESWKPSGKTDRRQGRRKEGECGFLTEGSERLGQSDILRERPPEVSRDREHAAWGLIGQFSVVEGVLPETFKQGGTSQLYFRKCWGSRKNLEAESTGRRL